MTCIRFIRTTHSNGRFRSFIPEAMRFWNGHGAIVGETLRQECPLTFAELVTACQEYVLEDPRPGLLPFLDEAHIAWCLIGLLEFGMAGPVLTSLDHSDSVDDGGFHCFILTNKEASEMTEVDKCRIPVVIVNLFTRRRLVQTKLPALPARGDMVYWRGLGYEVDHNEWTVLPNETAKIVVVVRPEMDADGRRPFSHEEEE
jgi:hypothetical protein